MNPKKGTKKPRQDGTGGKSHLRPLDRQGARFQGDKAGDSMTVPQFEVGPSSKVSSLAVFEKNF